MKQKLINLVFVFFILKIFLSYIYSADNKIINIEADKLEYEPAQNKILATGNVLISSGIMNIKTDNIKFNLEQQTIITTSPVEIIDNNLNLKTNGLNYNLNTSSGFFYKCSGFFKPWYFFSGKMKKEKNIYFCEETKITSCDLSKPHYFMYTNNSKLVPGEKIDLKNSLLTVHGIPVFFVPYYRVYFKEKKDVWYIYPGYDSVNGFTAKIIYGFPLTENMYTKLYFDNYTLQGIGYGFEQNYILRDKTDSETAKGTFYTYYIREEKTQQEKWNLRYLGWNKLSKSWNLQTQIDFLSDASFNNLYYKDNWYWLKSSLNSNIAFTKQTSKTLLRISGSRIDTYDQQQNKYLLDTFSAPNIEFTLYPVKPKYSPVYFGLNSNIGQFYYRTYSNIPDFTYINSSNNLYFYRTIKLANSVSITPKVGLLESWQDKTPFSSTQVYLTNYYSETNLRTQLGNSNSLDFNYLFKNRMIKNSFQELDYQSDDYGIEKNQLNLSFFSFPYNNIFLKITSGYDFRRFRTETEYNWLTKFSPVITELNLNINKLGIYVREEHLIYIKEQQTSKNNLLDKIQLDSTLGDINNNYITLGISYNRSFPQIYNFRNAVGVWFGKKWYFKYETLFNVDNTENKTSFLFQQQKLNIYRDLHCWIMSVSYLKREKIENLKRQEIEEFFFNIALKISVESKPQLFDKQKIFNTY